MKSSDYIARYLKEIGVEYIFGYQGANVSHIIDSICREEGIRYIETYNEQGASFAANGYTLATGKLGVAIASSGPGAINLLSGIANSFFDSIPCLFITGNVGQAGMKKKLAIRQNSFQELNIVEMTKGITKYSVMIETAEEIPVILMKAIAIAFDGRPGAVHLDIPHNIQKNELDINGANDVKIEEEKMEEDSSDINENIFINSYLDSLALSRRPLILIGGGVVSSLSKAEIDSLIRKLNVPVVATLNGLSGINASSDNFVGFIGDYGNRYANYAIHTCDNLLILGSRLDDRQIGGDKTKFANNAKIFRIDIDEIELSRINVNANNLQADIKKIHNKIMKKDLISKNFSEWKDNISSWKKRFPSFKQDTQRVHVNTYFNYLSSLLDCDYIVCSDVGQHQMAVAQSFAINDKGRLFNSGGLGAMGFSLPAAIGAKYAFKDSLVLAISGDGGIQMNLQELQVIQRDKLNIKIIVINNNCLGMIRQYQKFALASNFYGSLIGYENPKFCKIAEAYGIQYLNIDSTDKYSRSLELINNEEACLIEISIDNEIELIPEMGLSIIEQNPLVEFN